MYDSLDDIIAALDAMHNSKKLWRKADYWVRCAGEAASYLRKIASGELAPVVHAHWHENWKHTDGRVNRDCSVCHGRTDEYTPTPICPWCGALMDGKIEAIHKD